MEPRSLPSLTPLSATARSSFPSPLKSAATQIWGLRRCIGCARLEAPVLSPRNTASRLRETLRDATSGNAIAMKSPATMVWRGD
jgi:hypothetical protein